MCGTDTVERDEDGDYVLPIGSVPIYATLLAGRPHLLHLFAIAARVGESPELLAELDALNESLPFLELFARSGTVLACADLDATMLHPDELSTLAGTVAGAAADLGPLLGGLFGGTRESA